MFHHVFQLTDRRKSLSYPVPLQLSQSSTFPPGIQVGLQWLLVSLERIFKAGIRSQSDHESEAKGGTFTQLPASSSSKCTAGTSLTSSQMAKRKPWGIKALLVVLCLEQPRIPCNGKGDHGELQMFPAAPLCSSTGSPCWQLCHRGLDGSKAVRSQRSRAGVCSRWRKQSHSYKVAVKSPATRLHQQLGTVSQITTHFFT